MYCCSYALYNSFDGPFTPRMFSFQCPWKGKSSWVWLAKGFSWIKFRIWQTQEAGHCHGEHLPIQILKKNTLQEREGLFMQLQGQHWKYTNPLNNMLWGALNLKHGFTNSTIFMGSLSGSVHWQCRLYLTVVFLFFYIRVVYIQQHPKFQFDKNVSFSCSTLFFINL